MGEASRNNFSFGDFILDPTQKLLLRNGEIVKLPAKTLELLTYLVENSNRVINKNEIMEAVWQDSLVEDANLSVHISTLRKVFGNGNGEQEPERVAIETFPKVGYRFNADVTAVERVPFVNGKEETVTPPHVVKFPVKDTGFLSILRSRAVLIGAASVILLASGYSISRWFREPGPRTPTMTAIPGLENSTSIALSPNGQYVAGSLLRDGRYSLVLAHVGGGGRLELVPPQERGYLGITFSPDNSFLYYVKAGDDRRPLYKIPILGGSPTKVTESVDNHISFSPSGDRFCFVRRTPPNETSILVANTDGTAERVIATKRSPESFSSFDISWSPDGRLIANAVANWNGRKMMSLVGVDVDSGTETLLSDATWAGVDGLAWLPDGTGLIGGFFTTGNSPTEVAIVPYPSGEIRRLTTDTLNYGSVAISSDGKTVLAGQFKDYREIWLSSFDGTEDARPLTTERRHSFRWIRWTSDERLVFGSDINGTRDVWIMNAEGSGERQLTSNSGNNVMPVLSEDGRTLVFASNRSGTRIFDIWKTNENGEDPVQLSLGQGSNQPSMTPDGRWVFFTSGGIDAPKGERRVWKVSINGGEPIPFISEPSYGPAVSPDGKLVVAWIKASDNSPWQIAVYRLDGGSPIKVLDLPEGPPVVWTPDGRSLTFLKSEKGVSNLWNQPLNGRPPVAATRFTSDRITHFHWSKTGKLAVARTFRTGDIVLIRNFD